MKYLFILSLIFVSKLSFAKHVHMFHPDGGFILVFDDNEHDLIDFSAKQANSDTLKIASSTKRNFFEASGFLMDELKINLLKAFFEDDEILNVIIVTAEEEFYLHDLAFYMNTAEENLTLKLDPSANPTMLKQIAP